MKENAVENLSGPVTQLTEQSAKMSAELERLKNTNKTLIEENLKLKSDMQFSEERFLQSDTYKTLAAEAT